MLALSKCNSKDSNVWYFLIIIITVASDDDTVLSKYWCATKQYKTVCVKAIIYNAFPTEFIMWSWQFSKEVHNTPIGKHWHTYLCLTLLQIQTVDTQLGYLEQLEWVVTSCIPYPISLPCLRLGFHKR